MVNSYKKEKEKGVGQESTGRMRPIINEIQKSAKPKLNQHRQIQQAHRGPRKFQCQSKREGAIEFDEAKYVSHSQWK